MTVLRFDHCPDMLELHDNDISIEYTEKHGLEMCVMVNNYGERSTSYEERYFFLSRDEALELAEFIMEQVKCKK